MSQFDDRSLDDHDDLSNRDRRMLRALGAQVLGYAAADLAGVERMFGWEFVLTLSGMAAQPTFPCRRTYLVTGNGVIAYPSKLDEWLTPKERDQWIEDWQTEKQKEKEKT